MAIVPAEVLLKPAELLIKPKDLLPITTGPADETQTVELHIGAENGLPKCTLIYMVIGESRFDKPNLELHPDAENGLPGCNKCCTKT